MPSSSRPRLPFEVWALVAGGFSVALGYGVVAPAIPQFALEFGVSIFAASAIVSAFAFMRVLGAPVGGFMVSRFGERVSYVTGILIVAVSTGATALSANYVQFITLRAVGGIGSAMFTVAATALLVKVSPVDSRARVASLNSAGFLLGGLLGPVFGGVVAGFGLRAPFVFYFIMLVIAALVVALALRGSSHTAVQAGPAVGASAAEAPMALREAFRLPPFRALLLSVFSFGWSAFGVRISVIPLFVAVAFQGDAALAAWVLAAYALGDAILIFPSGRWNDTIGRKPMLIIGMVLLAASYALFPTSPSVWVACAFMVVAGAGSALVNPGQQAVLADVLAGRRGGQVVASYSMMSDLGGVLGPLLAGALIDLAGFGWAFGVTALLLTAAALTWAFTRDSRSAQSSR